MARYRLKRKCYNALTEAAGNTLGGVTEGVGKALDNKVAGIAGGVLGATKLGGTIWKYFRYGSWLSLRFCSY